MIFTRLSAVTLAGLLGLAGCASSQTPAPATATTETPATTATTATPSTGGAATAQADAFQRVTVDELAGLIDHHENVAIFDNNRRERYEQGHIPGARWVSYDQVNAQVLPADRNARLVFYCANEQCHACHNAAQAAITLGYHNVSILPAGIMGWTAANKPVIAGANPS